MYLHTTDMPQCDVVIVCLKSVNNGKLEQLLPPLLHANTLVVLIQNGIGVEEDVQMLEVIGAARHLGVKNIDESFADKMIEMTDVMVPYSPSMKLDFEFHRSMEIHYLYTRPLQIAREAGFPMHKLEMLEAELRFIESTYKGK